MWYVKRGFAAFRHGSLVLQSCVDRIGRSALLESVGAVAKKFTLAPALLVENTNAAMRPLKVPVCTAPWSAPTTM
jgi:hypothetical protein